jgi:hypothetical protein
MRLSPYRHYNGVYASHAERVEAVGVATFGRVRFVLRPARLDRKPFGCLRPRRSRAWRTTLYHHSEDHHVHGYMGLLKLTGGIGLVLAFALAMRMFFKHGTFGEWLREGSLSGTVRQVTLSTVLPAAAFVLAEYLERLAAGTGTYPSTLLLTVGVLAQLAVGLLCLALVRFTFRVAERVIHSIARHGPVRRVQRMTCPTVESAPLIRLPCPMADSVGGRAPPFDQS